jgi:hypothetical protein
MAELWADIGEAAGTVYSALDGLKKGKSIADLKKKTKLKDAMLYMACGWLAREDKVELVSGKAGKITCRLR